MTDLSPEALLDLALKNPAAGEELKRRFGSEGAILVVDFSSMRARTDAFGIIHALATVRAACAAYRPAIEENEGHEVKIVADTLFARFARPHQALKAALDGHVRLGAFNESRTGSICAGVPGAPIHPKTGLGYGDVLAFSGDLFGAEVNRAFILGEDVARDGEILASTAFASALGTPPAGVGVHSSPHDRAQEAGFPFEIYTDFREPPALSTTGERQG